MHGTCIYYVVFLGHGVFNATIELDPNSYTRTVDETIYESADPVGECLVGIKGKLYSVMELKHDLLKLKTETLTLTLDMCRDSRSGMLQKVR